MHGPLLLLLARWMVSTDAVGSTDKQTITYKAGDNVTFPCLSNNTLDTFQWRKSEMKQDECLFRWREGRELKCNQDPSLHGRVVRSNQSTDCSASIVLMKTNASDAGTYEYRVPSGDGESKVNYTVELKFEDGGNKTGPNHVDTWSAGVIAAIVVVAAVGVVAAVLICCPPPHPSVRFRCYGRRCPCSTPEPNNPNAGEEGVPLEVIGTQTVQKENSEAGLYL